MVVRGGLGECVKEDVVFPRHKVRTNSCQRSRSHSERKRKRRGPKPQVPESGLLGLMYTKRENKRRRKFDTSY